MRIIGHDHATVTNTAEILTREERITAHQAQCPGFFQSTWSGRIARPDGLGGIFNNRNAVFTGNLQYRIEVGTLTIQMYRNNGLDFIDFGRIFLKPHLQTDRIKIKSLRVDINENRFCTQTGNYSGSCEKRIGCGNHQIARLDLQSH